MAGATSRNDQGSWAIRRRFMFAITAFCMGTVAYSLGAQLQTSVADTAVTFSFLTLIAITGSYVFGAIWEDVSVFKAGGTRTTITATSVTPAPDMSGPVEPEPDK